MDSDSTYDVNSETPTVHTGGYLFVKTDGDKKLSGAKFALYATEEDAKEQKNALQTAMSDENGNVSFMGLAYGSFSADEEGKSTACRTARENTGSPRSRRLSITV